MAYRENTEQIFKSGADTYSSAISSAHNYMHWILSPFRPYMHGRIVEVGIGHGSYCDELSKYGDYLGIDIDQRSIDNARQRFPFARFARSDILRHGFLDELMSEKIDTVVSINVLEHIKDDAMAIENLVDSLRSGGNLLLVVPALMALYNDMDRLAGHERRYSLRDIRRLLEHQPVRIQRLCYFNPLGGLGWWINRLMHHDSLDSDDVNQQIRLFDKYVVPMSRLLDPVFRGFFGQSVICVAQRV